MSVKVRGDNCVASGNDIQSDIIKLKLPGLKSEFLKHNFLSSSYNIVLLIICFFDITK